MTVHPVADAFPDGATSADAIRQSLSVAFPLVLEAADDIADMDLTGLVVREVRVNSIAFLYDAADETSQHDGVTTLVSQNGYRFIAEISAGAFVSVLSVAGSPPMSPVVGDKHIVGAAPSGVFADHADDLAVLTSRGWEFAAPVIGQRVYVRGVPEYRYWSESGSWAQDGVADASVQARHLQFPFGMAVESETDTPPGGTPAAGTKWIVAANATGAWDDWDGDIAEADGAGGFRRLSAYAGATVADKALKVLRTFDAGTGTWKSSGGLLVGGTRQFTDTGGTTGASNNAYTYSDTVAPTINANRTHESTPLAYQARAAGAVLEFDYDFNLSSGGGIGHSLALFRDSETNAIAWSRLSTGAIQQGFCKKFYVTAPDANSHNYTFAVCVDTNNTAERPTLTRRSRSVKEWA